MKFKAKPIIVQARPFEGTITSANDLKEWVSSADISDVELSWQGEYESLQSAKNIGLDIITEQGLRTLEKGDWLVIRGGKLYAENTEEFERAYEPLN